MSGQALQTFLLNMLDASVVTLEVFFLTLLFSLPLGLVFAAARMSRRKWVRVPMESFLLIIRGTPLILQLIFFYFVPPDLLGIGLPRFWAAILAFSINYAAYFAEIFRGGIQAIDPGQIEAAKVLGFGKMQTFFRITLPQVVKIILPSMGNEFMTLVKDTALAQTIGVAEIFRLANTSASGNFSTLPIIIAGIFYFAMNGIVSLGFSYLSRKLSYYK
ncbi:amino acid ABC transporter permease [Christensenellaceae bacterium 44-20]|jgi:polar amino acid transport system permease protein